MNNQFESKGRDQNVAQGDRGIGQQNNYGISPEVFAEYVSKLAVTETALTNFFKILEEHQVSRDDLDSKLREIAAIHKELLERLSSVQSEDPQVVKLKQEAKQAIEKHEYGKAEELLKKAEARDLEAIEKMEQAARQRRISAAATNADQADLQRVQLRYAKAAEYWQKAAALLPKGEKKDRAHHLHEAGYDLRRLSRSTEAQPLYEQSLALYREIGDRAGEGTTLGNMGAIYHARGDYDTALKYLEQSLEIRQEVGDRAGEGTTLNNISLIYDARGDYDKALKYLEQSLKIRQEVGDRAGEGVTQNNISGIHWAQGDYTTALKYLEQSLEIRQEIGDRAGEGTILNNISQIYGARGDDDTAFKYLEQSLEISRKIGNRAMEGTTLNNIGLIYDARGEYDKALALYEQSLTIRQEVGDRAGEGTTLNNISQIYDARGDYDTALKYLEQSLELRQEIGDRRGEAVTSWNIGLTYRKQGDLTKAEQYISRAVEIMEAIGHPETDNCRKTLEKLRAEIKGQ
jgi:tetratricopeptide (TPR) repeat protein